MYWMSCAMRGFPTSFIVKLWTIGCMPHTTPRANSTANWSGYFATISSTSGLSGFTPQSGSHAGTPPGVAYEPNTTAASR